MTCDEHKALCEKIDRASATNHGRMVALAMLVRDGVADPFMSKFATEALAEYDAIQADVATLIHAKLEAAS
jgi:hypothetical protein